MIRITKGIMIKYGHCDAHLHTWSHQTFSVDVDKIIIYVCKQTNRDFS